MPKGNLGNNLISCKEHIDKNSDMLCDFCGLELPVSDYLKQKSIETVASDNSIVKITGNMLENTMIKAVNISNVKAVTLAKNFPDGFRKVNPMLYSAHFPINAGLAPT